MHVPAAAAIAPAATDLYDRHSKLHRAVLRVDPHLVQVFERYMTSACGRLKSSWPCSQPRWGQRRQLRWVQLRAAAWHQVLALVEVHMWPVALGADSKHGNTVMAALGGCGIILILLVA